jgi:uncharacterized damage-inducible protein DinB
MSAGTSTIDPTVASLLADLQNELASTRRMLALVPFAHADWKPHEKSSTLLKLASHVVQLPSFMTIMIVNDVFEMVRGSSTPAPVGSTEELLAVFDGHTAALHRALTTLTAETVHAPWSMTRGGAVFLKGPRSAMLRTMGISHLVHHRGQLSVYLRLLDVKVPGMYGPSADDV